MKRRKPCGVARDERSKQRLAPFHKYKINMQYKIYTIPVIEGESETEGLNKLLRANKIVKVDKERRKA